MPRSKTHLVSVKPTPTPKGEALPTVEPELLELAVSVIDEPGLPSRETMDSDDMQELMNSIQALGLISPIQVVRKGERFEVAAGHRRLLAHKYLHRESIRAFVYPEGYELSDAVMLHENTVREQLNPAQEAVFICQLIDKYHYTEAQLMERLKRSANYLADRVNLLRGDPMVFEYLRDGRIGFSVARVLNRFTDTEIRHYYLECATRSGATARVVEDWLDQWRTRVQPAIEAAQQQQATAEALPPAEDTMKCFLCGGGKDKFNLRNVWIHYWELDQVVSALQKQAEAIAIAQAESKLSGGSHGAN